MVALPGNMTLGLLQEDNPMKGFFRFRPMAIYQENRYVKIEGGAADYPDDGYIRVVPDKNELAQFRTRMRSLGRCCMLDLRNYPGENEKIRPNKNYGIGPECNQSIVYSDVVISVPHDTMAEVLEAQYVFVGEQVTLRADRPSTRYVMVRREGEISGPWVWSVAPDVEGCILLSHAPDMAFSSAPEEDVQDKYLTLEGERGRITLLVDGERFGGTKEQAREERAPEADAAAQEAPDADAVGSPAAGAAAPVAEAEPHAPEPEEPKPWIQKTAIVRSRAVQGRISLRDRALMEQSGINPRRGRSLSEVVDEQWRKSRYEQLGHPVPSLATGLPTQDPIERAMAALNDAWAVPGARARLIDELVRDPDWQQAIAERMSISVQERARTRDGHMEELESERLKLMTEIDAIRQRRDSTKAQLMEELKSTHHSEVQQYDEQIAALKEERQRNETAARSAQKAAEAANEMLKKTADQLDQHLLTHIMSSRAIELMGRAQSGYEVSAHHPDIYAPTAGELISDLRVMLGEAGFDLGNADTVALLAAMHVGGMVVVSGPTGSGKSGLVRQLAAALGLSGQAGRFLETRTPDDARIPAFLDHCDALTPSILLIDDINLAGDRAINDAIRIQEEAHAKGIPLCIMLTVQDAPDGHPLSARLLARAFLVRLDAAPVDARWKPPTLSKPAPERAVALSAIRDILSPESDLEGEVVNRIATLRARLGEMGYLIDRRTLNELWIYCTSIVRAGRLTGMQALDRALASRALPAMLAAMDMGQLAALPEMLSDMPLCVKLMDEPLPLPPLWDDR